jgi:hypothetical protein
VVIAPIKIFTPAKVLKVPAPKPTAAKKEKPTTTKNDKSDDSMKELKNLLKKEIVDAVAKKKTTGSVK